MDPKVLKSGVLIGNEGRGWGSSLAVPSVQELVRRDPYSVPERYIRENLDGPKGAYHGPLSPNLPVIDFSLLSSGDEGERRNLDLACKEWGFFQMINHGVAEDVLGEMRNVMARFFELPLEQKQKYSMASNDIEGYGQACVVSEEQKLDWSDLIVLFTLPCETRNLKYWPTVVPEFKEVTDKYAEEMYRIAVELLGNLSLMMNMDKLGLLRLHRESKQAMRMTYYPTCSRPDQVLGLSPHSDSDSLTILLQDDDVIGLQIKYQEEWFPVKPIPNALIVNVGDVIEAWSNGVYKSVEHRAVPNDKKARMSLATFMGPAENVEIGPLQEMVDDVHRPKMYRTVKFIDYMRHTLGRKMDGKTHTHVLRLDNGCES